MRQSGPHVIHRPNVIHVIIVWRILILHGRVFLFRTVTRVPLISAAAREGAVRYFAVVIIAILATNALLRRLSILEACCSGCLSPYMFSVDVVSEIWLCLSWWSKVWNGWISIVSGWMVGFHMLAWLWWTFSQFILLLQCFQCFSQCEYVVMCISKINNSKN